MTKKRPYVHAAVGHAWMLTFSRDLGAYLFHQKSKPKPDDGSICLGDRRIYRDYGLDTSTFLWRGHTTEHWGAMNFGLDFAKALAWLREADDQENTEYYWIKHKEKKEIVIVSGYFNPLHKGHIEYFEEAKKYADDLWVIVNSDLQRELKDSKEFMDEEERLIVVSSLKPVYEAMLSVDKDKTVRESIRAIAAQNEGRRIIFANGGDQTNETIPEREVCEELGIELIDGLGDKVQSSSWLLKEEE